MIAVNRTGKWTRELYMYDIETHGTRRVCGFETKSIPRTTTWSPDNGHIAVELYRERSDIYISEPPDRTAIARR
jgi:hypothetical protein